MQHKKLELCAVLLLGLGLTGIYAQQAIPASGGDGSGGGGTVSYTVGQIFYNTNTGTNGSVAEGVQQPFEISIVTAVEEAKDITLEFVVYPNPATDFIVLKIGDYEPENLNYYLYDNGGKLIAKTKIQGSETSIPMQALPPATYFLKVSEKEKVLKTFKIIKK
jgi:hypothetical protein